MLPLYEKTCAKLDAMLSKRVSNVINANLGIMKEIKSTVQHEGDTSSLVRGDGTRDQLEMRTSDANLSIGEAEAHDLSLQELLAKWDSLGAAMATSMKKNFYLTVSETLQKYNRVTKLNDAPTVSDILDMYRDLQIDFNPDGSPQLPKMVCGKEFFDKVKALNEDPNNLVSFKTGMDEIITQKRKDWHARENARKLAD